MPGTGIQHWWWGKARCLRGGGDVESDVKGEFRIRWEVEGSKVRAGSY